MGQSIYYKYVFAAPSSSYAIGDVLYDARVTCIVDAEGYAVPFALWRPPDGSAFEDFCLLFSHGNAEDIALLAPLMHELSVQLGVATAVYEYAGYGPAVDGSDGDDAALRRRAEASEHACCVEIRAAFDHLRSACGFQPARIVLYGRSLGSGPSVQLACQLSAARLPFGGVVLQSPFASIVSVLSPLLAHITPDMFNNAAAVDKVLRPFVIVHGCLDELVPLAHAEQLVAAVRRAASENESRLFRFVPLAQAAHNDIELLYWDDLVITIGDFLQHLLHEDHFAFFAPRPPAIDIACRPEPSPSCEPSSSCISSSCTSTI